MNSEKELLARIQELEKELKSIKKQKKYGLVWEDKPEQIVEDCKRNVPILRLKEKKKGIDPIVTTDDSKGENILIEGDNYQALSVLNYTHKGKIDVIYIDPPYNTGSKDFVYNDNYVDKEDSFRHSKWLSFIYKRLMLAKELLSKSGAIFISIDDNEQANLKVLCDEIFGENNFVANVPWKGKGGGADNKYLMVAHEYILIYAKNKDDFSIGEQVKEKTGNYNKFDSIKNKNYKTQLVRKWGSNSRREDRPNLYYGVSAPDRTIIYPLLPDGKEGCWRWSKATLGKEIEEGNVEFVKNDAGWILYEKIYEPGIDEIITKKYSTWFDEYGNTAEGSKRLFEIFGSKEFDYPKPLKLLKNLINIGSASKKATILDFVAGSGTTGHAVLELNKEDGGDRKFILCTNNELNGVGSELSKQFPDQNKDKFGICERVTYQRLKKVINGYNKNDTEEKVEGLGGNLRYYKTDLVDIEKLNHTPDHAKVKLTYQAGEMIALREDTLNEVEKNEWWQIFEGPGKTTAIYFKEDKEKLPKLVEVLEKKKQPVTLYIFSWGKNEYNSEYSTANIRVEDIPEPILEVYKEINRL